MAYFKTDDNCKIYYETYGEGSPLVFVHGWSCDSTFFINQIDFFAKNHKVIVFDLRGHGKSDKSSATGFDLTLDRAAKDLHQIIEYLSLDNPSLCGWSMGTSILLNYVQLYGCENLKSLCFIDMTPKLLKDSSWDLGDFYHEENLEFCGDIFKDWNEVCEAFAPTIFAKGTSPDSNLCLWVKEKSKNNIPHIMAGFWIAMALKDYRPVLEQISCPTFLAYSGDGQMYGPTHGDYMKSKIEKSTLKIFLGCGHGLFLEDPDNFNKSFLGFLNSL